MDIFLRGVHRSQECPVDLAVVGHPRRGWEDLHAEAAEAERAAVSVPEAGATLAEGTAVEVAVISVDEVAWTGTVEEDPGVAPAEVV